MTEPQQSPARSARQKVARLAIVAVVILGALLRFAGLSHDLDAGNSYHPDTPKQVRAVERFLDGKYYFYIGHSDYDGYPYFASHLVEWTCRAIVPLVNGARALVGVSPHDGWPKYLTLYWIMRIFNAAMASWLVYLLFAGVRREWGAAAGLLSAFFLAVSPADVAACHYENGDTAAGFFAALAVLWALRVYRTGSFGDIVAGTFFAVCSFSAKYHGGLAGLAVALAFALRQRSLRACFSDEAWRGWLTMAVVAVASLFISIPSMFIHPVRMIEHIHGFLTYASSFHLPQEVAASGFLGKVTYGLRINLPVLNQIIGSLVSCTFLLAVVLALRGDRRLLIMSVLPITYIFIALGLRAQSHPVYHTLITPIVFAAVAVVLTIPRRRGFRWSVRALSFLFMCVSGAYLLGYSRGEAFFFMHRDTRRMAKDWTRENVPHWFAATRGPYTFSLPDYARKNPMDGERLWLSSSIRPSDPPGGYFLLKKFELEVESLPLFRNPVIGIYLRDGHVIRDGFTLPVYQRTASNAGGDLSFLPDHSFYRSQNILQIRDAETTKRFIISEKPVSRPMVIMRGGRLPSDANMALGGRNVDIRLESNEVRAETIETPTSCSLSRDDIPIYSWTARSRLGKTWITLAVTPEEKGVALFNQGLYADALPWLVGAQRDLNSSPTLAAMALLASHMDAVAVPDSTRQELRAAASWLDSDLSEDSVLKRYGVSEKYLRGLPYLEWEAEKLPRRSFEIVHAGGADAFARTAPAPGSNATWSMYSQPLFLEPGVYRVTLRARVQSPGDGAHITLRNGARAILWEADVRFPATPPGEFKRLSIRLPVPEAVSDGYIEWTGDETCKLDIDRMAIAPDPSGSLHWLRDAVRVTEKGEWDKGRADAMLYGPLLTLGRRLGSENRVDDAIDVFAEAARIRPDALAPYQGIAGVRKNIQGALSAEAEALLARYDATAAEREFHPAAALFEGGIRLVGFRLGNQVGDNLRLNLYWRLEKPIRNLSSLGVWMHIQQAGGKMFQGDHSLLVSLANPRADGRIAPDFIEIPVPPDMPPGDYMVRVGLCNPSREERIRVVDTALATKNKGVYLPLQITIAP